MATFNQLLNSYNSAVRCPGPFPDQCAIKLGQALEGAGVSTASFRGQGAGVIRKEIISFAPSNWPSGSGEPHSWVEARPGP